MKHRFNSPVIGLGDELNFGTVNPEALKLPMLNKKTVPNKYETISQLAIEIGLFSREIVDTQNRIKDMIDDKNPSAFCVFQKWLNEFDERLDLRESELEAFLKHVSSYRTDSMPTFVEVNASNEKRPTFDSLSYSLLVSNHQKNFFAKSDISQQNMELMILIEQQQKAIKKFSSRLALFDQFQSQNSIKYTIEALKKGEIPKAFSSSAPTKAAELRHKRRILSQELVQIVKQRKTIMKSYYARKEQAKKERIMRTKAIFIQSIIRGYLARRKIKLQVKAAVTIQRIFRGFIFRYLQKKAIRELEEYPPVTSLFEDKPVQ